jgi:hypothetical protein
MASMSKLLATTFKPMPTAEEKHHMILILEKALQIVEGLPESRACSACDHGRFSAGRHCELYAQDIPEAFQPIGCDQFIDIPF